jgi:hypothetical protein
LQLDLQGHFGTCANRTRRRALLQRRAEREGAITGR